MSVEREKVLEYLGEILLAEGDSEMQHGTEDALHDYVLELAAANHPETAELATLALTTLEMDFSRWYA